MVPPLGNARKIISSGRGDLWDTTAVPGHQRQRVPSSLWIATGAPIPASMAAGNCIRVLPAAQGLLWWRRHESALRSPLEYLAGPRAAFGVSRRKKDT